MEIPKVVVAGGSGFIGRPLCRALWDNGRREVWALSRTAREIPYAHVVRWDGREPGEWTRALEGAHAVVNLCGAGLPRGRGAKALRDLEERRLTPTRALAAALAAAKAKPRVFISASAVGYYGDRGEEPLLEDADGGDDALALLCAEWEKAALRAPPEVRTVVLRAGLVLALGGGALRSLITGFRLGLGGALGTGKQFVSWITREDLIGLTLHLLDHDVSGPVNAVAPKPLSNEDFSRELAAALRRPCRIRLPGGVARVAFGEVADVLMAGQRVLPRRASLSGYAFKSATLADALRAELAQQ